MYAFNHRTSGNPWPAWSGDALHGYEIDHVFGVPYRGDSEYLYSHAEMTLSRQMMTYWTNFAKTGYVSTRCSAHHRCKNVQIKIKNVKNVKNVTKIKKNVCKRNKTRSSAIAEEPRDASGQLKSCQLPRNSAETACTTSPEQIEVMKLES